MISDNIDIARNQKLLKALTTQENELLSHEEMYGRLVKLRHAGLKRRPHASRWIDSRQIPF